VLSNGRIGMAGVDEPHDDRGARSRTCARRRRKKNAASESFEDLERYPAADPNVAVTSASIVRQPHHSDNHSIGGLPRQHRRVDYFDTTGSTVAMAADISERPPAKTLSGNTNFTTITHLRRRRYQFLVTTLPRQARIR